MNNVSTNLTDAAHRLHRHLVRRHLRDALLAGPDPGIRLNLRVWRLLKSYAGLIHGPERHVFMQTMGYWILANWLLFDRLGGEYFRHMAIQGSDALVASQRHDGAWRYPLRERRHLVATIEGNWASLALWESYRRTNDERYRTTALTWKAFLLNKIGFQSYRSTLAVNYFDLPRGNVPNNTTNTIWFLAESACYEPDPSGEEKIEAMKAFLKEVQLPNGEFPYIVESPYEKEKVHYLCYQYNAFEFLDLYHYYKLRSDRDVLTLLRKLAGFLSQGMTEDGWTKASCLHARPCVLYYTAALATALWKAYEIELIDTTRPCCNGLSYLLRFQTSLGSFPHSFYDYGVLSDRRSYPRYQAMILYFLALIDYDLTKDR